MQQLRFTLICLFIVAALPVFAQNIGLADFNQNRLNRTRNSMLVLGGWAAANIVVGAVGAGRGGAENKAFQQMNLGWGLINLGLAGAGWWTATHTDPASFDLYGTINEHHRMQKILLFNAGLDVGYMAAGFWMQEKSKTDDKNPERWKGFGRSLVLQGAFLMVFDLSAFFYLNGLETQLKPLITGNGELGVLLRF